MASPPIRQPVRIIGIDPGLRRTGWGVVETDGNQLGLHRLRLGRDRRTIGRWPAALLAIHEGLREVLGDRSAPTEAAVEQTFVNKDGVATLKLGQARGIAMLVPALFGLAVAEYAPNLVKKTVVGAGHADKAQIARDGEGAAAEGRPEIGRCRRRAGHRHLARPSPRQHQRCG